MVWVARNYCNSSRGQDKERFVNAGRFSAASVYVAPLVPALPSSPKALLSTQRLPIYSLPIFKAQLKRHLLYTINLALFSWKESFSLNSQSIASDLILSRGVFYFCFCFCLVFELKVNILHSFSSRTDYRNTHIGHIVGL